MDVLPKGPAFRNTITIIGAALTTFAAVLFLIVFFADLFGLHTNPYIGILFFLILPGVFILGLVMIPIGIIVERRRRRLGLPPAQWPRIDFNDPRQRQVTWIIFLLTM